MLLTLRTNKHCLIDNEVKMSYCKPDRMPYCKPDRMPYCKPDCKYNKKPGEKRIKRLKMVRNRHLHQQPLLIVCSQNLLLNYQRY